MFEPVVKVVSVPVGPEAAFDRFIRQMDSWWPRATHSVTEDQCREVAFDERVGGHPFERDMDGNVHIWGTISVWEPPARVVFSWHPKREPETAQEVEITFTAQDGGTLVRLEHRGWEALGDIAAEQREMYDNGWQPVLALFAGSLARASIPS